MSYRGRSQNRSTYRGRGNSSSRGAPSNPQFRRRRSFEEIEADALKAQAEKTKQVEEVKAKPVPAVDEEKKQSMINKGAQWFNKFFGGIKRKERGNLRLEFNQHLDLELMDVYNYKLSNLAFTKNYYEAFHVGICGDFFRVYINGLIGIKLLKANTISSKVVMKEFLPLANLDLKVPKNLNSILNALGKTDVGNDNVVRIIGQNSVIKQCFFKSVMLLASFDRKRFFNNMIFKEDITFDHVTNYVNENILKIGDISIYTKDQAGLDLIHETGRKAIDMVNNTNLVVGKDANAFEVRVPYLDPKHLNDLDKLLEWADKVGRFFEKSKIDPDNYATALSYAFMGWFPLKFIRESKKSFGTLDSSFQGTIFQDIIPQKMLRDHNWIAMEDYLTDADLYHNIIATFDYYKSSIEPIYDDIFNMIKFEPTEFGNGAQTVVVNAQKRTYLNFTKHDFSINMADNSKPGNIYSRITDEEAVVGSVFNFNNGVTLNSSYDIHTISSAKEIRLAYLGHDFK